MPAPLPPLRSQLLLALLFGVAGLLLNTLRFESFFSVDVIFGSVFVMLVILRAGVGPGVVAALIAGSTTVVLWNHPWALAVLAGEALMVGWLVRRRAWDLLVADIAYWAVLGAPLVWVFYHHALHIQAQGTVLIILKQAINGIINTLLAYLIHLAWSAWAPSLGKSRPAFRSVVFGTMVSLVAFPALLFLVAYVRLSTQQEEQLLTRQCADLSQAARGSLNDWLEDKHHAIATLAALVARPGMGAADRQSATETVRNATPAFKRVVVLDARADVIAISPLIDDEGHSGLGKNFSDRPFIPILKGTLRPYVGDLVMARIGPPVPMLPLLVPVVRQGRYDGYCSGITNTDHIREILQNLGSLAGAEMTVIDRNGLVTCTTRKDLAVMSSFQQPAGEIRPLGRGAWQWIPNLLPGNSRMQRWTRSFIISEASLSEGLPWKIRVEVPMAPLIGNLTRIAIFGLGALLLLILGTVALAQFLSRRFTASIARLEVATRAFPSLLHADPATSLALPASSIEEIHHLNGRFQQMTEALRLSFHELSDLKDTLEQRVTTRTQELQTALDTIKTLHGIIPICASCKKIRDDQGSWNQLETYISQHTDADFTHGICPDCAKRLYPDLHRRETDR